jgi:hypothetical protein
MRLPFEPTIASIFARALAYAVIATPAQAHTYECCRRDVTSFAQSCSFDTLAQCLTVSSGRGGDCSSNPFLSDASGAYACAPIRTPTRVAPRKNHRASTADADIKLRPRPLGQGSGRSLILDESSRSKDFKRL